MGQGAESGRRALILKVKECIDHVNGSRALVDEARQANNGLAAQTGKDVAELRARLDTHKAWLEKV